MLDSGGREVDGFSVRGCAEQWVVVVVMSCPKGERGDMSRKTAAVDRSAMGMLKVMGWTVARIMIMIIKSKYSSM